MQGRNLTHFARYDAPGAWTEPHFVLGIATMLAGAVINLQADTIMINLRKDDNDKEYRIPRGGFFHYVSGANFFGEIVEWAGFAIANWSLPAAAFAAFTFCNIAPRGAQHHAWYRKKFADEYPRERKAVIPFLW